jgi:predicted phosphodiesterase
MFMQTKAEPGHFLHKMLSEGDETPDRAEIDFSQAGRALIISDFHAGAGGSNDDLDKNGRLVEGVLSGYYLCRDYHLILNGDIEELQRFSLREIMREWKSLYAIFDAFNAAGRLYKNVGNHDAGLYLENNYPYTLTDSVLIRTKTIPVFVFHGHQNSNIYTRYSKFLALAVRYFLKPFHIGNITSARSPRKRFATERKAYQFSLDNGVLSVIGHTHRPLFESQGRFESILYEIEYYCRTYPDAKGDDRKKIKDEVGILRSELSKLQKSERRDILRESLYGGAIPVPCLFNSGSVIGKKGIYAIELDAASISLVYWWEEGRNKKFVYRGNYKIEELSGTPWRKTILSTATLENIKARIELLG